MHTKLPWKGQDEKGQWLPTNTWSARHDSARSSSSAPIHSNGKVVALVVSTSFSDRELEDNAVLIIRAVNCHQQLIDALRGMCDVWKTTCDSKGHDPDHMLQYTTAIALLKKAKS